MGAREYFSGQRVLITGGSSGIGLAFARKIASLGAKPVLVARRQAVLDEAKASIERRVDGALVDTIAVDVANESDVEGALAGYLDKRPVDMVVNNAGVVMPGRFLELASKEFRQMMDVNYFGAVHVSKVVLPHLVAKKRGHVLNVSSLAGVLAIYGYTAYSASKFALVGFSQALRAEMWPHGVRVSVCFPPDTDTPQLEFENRYKPAETKAIAGTVKTLAPDVVADAMVEGMHRGSFEIFPDLASRMVAMGQGILPGVTRWVCDSAQKKARA